MATAQNHLKSAILAAFLLSGSTSFLAAKTTTCPGNDKALGVSRIVEIDTTGGPGFGFQHYKTYDFLRDKEVVITFDDGPQTRTTRAILAALKKECVRATFFPTGKQTVALPEILREVVSQGHTVGSHTYWHGRGTPRGKMGPLSKLKPELALGEIERGISAVVLAVGNKASPFFRYPQLRDTTATIKHLSNRNIGVFSTDIDSLDYKIRSTKRLVRRLMSRLAKKGKGIILLHDIQPTTAKAMPKILNRLKAGGYKIVHLIAKAPATSLPEYDAKVKAGFKSRANMAGGRPMSSVLRTVEQ